MTSKRLIQIIICITVAAAILIPAATLFDWGDYLYCTCNESANQQMMIEVLIIAAIIAAISFLVRKRKARLMLFAALLLVFCYIHSMLLPAAVAGIYFLAVMHIGNIVTGIAAVIIAESLLSLMNLGTPLNLGIAVLVMAVLYTVFRTLYKKEKVCCFCTGRQAADNAKAIHIFCLPEETSRWQLIINAIVLLVAMVQTGRASVAVRDFDSLWYGLRSEYVLAPGGSIFENLGLAGMVYVYSKGYEILTLPLNAFKSFAYLPVFNTCMFLVGLHMTWRIVKTLCINDDGSDAAAGMNSRCGVYSGDGLMPRRCLHRADRSVLRIRTDYDRAELFAGIAVIITAVIPGIVNMCLAAKPDMATWLLQLIMTERFFAFVRAEDRDLRLRLFFEILAAYLLSLTMKPTALIFSSALAGMMLIWWIVDVVVRKKSRDAGGCGADCGACMSKTGSRDRSVRAVISAAAAFISLCFVWGRTFILTGLPFASVFTGLLTALGFELKYPFASSRIPTRFKGDSVIRLVGKRAVRMMLSPEGDDMFHVSIAWCGSIMLVLAVVIIICIAVLIAIPPQPRTKNRMAGAAAMLFIPFSVLCGVTLAMLSQVDGNYYMTLYSIMPVAAMWLSYEAVTRCAERTAAAAGDAGNMMGEDGGTDEPDEPGTRGRSFIQEEKVPVSIVIAAAAMLACQFFIILITNWASAGGFTPIAFDRLYYDNENDSRVMLTAQAAPEAVAAGTTIYDKLAAEPEARVLAMGEHPACLQFNCVTESYSDVANPWGNPQLENSTDEFVEYLHFAGIDYIYVDGEYINRDECSWRRGMLAEMDARGLLGDYIYEGSNYLARVR